VTPLVFLLMLLAVAYERAAGLQAPTTVVQLAPGVYTRIGDKDIRQPANTSWIEFTDFVVVIDANTPWGSQAVLPEIRKTTGKPVRYVFDTHYHWDHTQGNSVLADAGITIVCSRDCAAELVGPKGTGEWQSMSRRTDQFSLAPYRLQPPSIVFGDFMAIDDGTRRLELRKVGPGHTVGDAVGYLPSEGILFTGDLCVNWRFGNNVGDRDGDHLQGVHALRVMGDWDGRTVVPGHGAVGARTPLLAQAACIEDLWQQVSAG
jgi:glyoxylase-like metal-dependent hydrolase (beta-lactamase superfamily II)